MALNAFNLGQRSNCQFHMKRSTILFLYVAFNGKGCPYNNWLERLLLFFSRRRQKKDLGFLRGLSYIVKLITNITKTGITKKKIKIRGTSRIKKRPVLSIFCEWNENDFKLIKPRNHTNWTKQFFVWREISQVSSTMNYLLEL